MLNVRQLEQRVTPYADRMNPFSDHFVQIDSRICHLNEDMQQHFGAVNERLTELVKSRAA